MKERYIKAKEFLDKKFYMMNMQAEKARAKGEVLMEKSDIAYLQNFTLEKALACNTLDLTGEEYNSKKVLSFIEKSQKDNYDYVTLHDKDLTITDCETLLKKGYFTDLEYPGWKVTHIFFTEKAYLEYQIGEFQNMLRSIVSMTPFVFRV